MTAAQEWRRAADRLAAAEADHLARRPTADLRDEYDQLRVRLNLTSSSDPGWPSMRRRLGMVDHALARQLDHAAARIEQEPAGYLVALLGDPPDHPALAAEWMLRVMLSYLTFPGRTGADARTMRRQLRQLLVPALFKLEEGGR